jgi:NADPH-dependent glutamate synthase beta subunit-like oxidoreductase/NAD(P)H-flavin reductase
LKPTESQSVTEVMTEQDVPQVNFALGWAGFLFSDLYDPRRLGDLCDGFWKFAAGRRPGIADRFAAHKAGTLSKPDESEVLIEVAGCLGEFVARLFDIGPAVEALRDDTRALDKIFQLKKDFLKTRVFRNFDGPAIGQAEFEALDADVQRLVAPVPAGSDPEIRFAECVLALLECEKALAAGAAGPPRELAERIVAHRREPGLSERVGEALVTLAEWCVQVNAEPARRERVRGWVSFVRPNKLDFQHLVQIDQPRSDLPELLAGPDEHRRLRVGFRLTDPRMNRKEALREIDYCIICHPREKDSCSHGFRDAQDGYQRNPLGIPLTGCPLEERISEMHELRKRGEAIAALAMIMLDNPMCPGTGHRICNDCMKGCIFQKQDPVNIPQAETSVVSDVLALPFGFEIYSLLTRFNPLNAKRPFPRLYNGVDVLVVGLGPAGYTLAHFLANEGFGVVGIDGLKLEPVDDELTGRGREFPMPIRDFSALQAQLDERIVMGFGGVSEYGITVRWDKTFLAVMYLTLLRRRNVRFHGGVRFGGTLKLDDAWELGFRHVALATGAGKPTVISMKNNLIRGIRKASDFLMALQLGGAFKRSSLANLQVRLPALVIGGGLTAIDTATELLAYYPVQVEKALAHFERLSREQGEEQVWKMCDPEETGILRTFLEHGRTVRAERERAASAGQTPDFVSLCQSWGGVSIVYRKKLTDSPAYRLNHEEVAKSLEEGVVFLENLSPVEALADRFGAVEALKFKRADGSEVVLPARSVCVAAGTTPNTVYEREFPGTFKLEPDGRFFQKYRLHPAGECGLLNAECGMEDATSAAPTPQSAPRSPHSLVASSDKRWSLEEVHEPARDAVFLSYENDGRLVSFYGDNHPDYAGNVVKAMASAKHGAPQISRLFADEIARAERSPTPLEKFEKLTSFLDEALVPRVVEVRRLTPTIVEVIVKARYAARQFLPGQFFRLQNYESSAPVVDGVRLTLEGVALTGAWVDPERDLLSLIVLEMGVSSRLCATLRPGEPVVVMGPTGAPSETPLGETVLLVGGGLGNAVLFSIGKALRDQGSMVLYFAGYKRREDVFMQEAIENATDQVVWAVDQGEPIAPRRPQDLTFVGNIVQALVAYARGALGDDRRIELPDVDRVIAIGSDRMMAAVAEARHGVLKPYLKGEHVAIASINSMMQCMLKEVCGQCLQRHVDPKTGLETEPVFTCFNQDQAMDCVDWGNLRARLKTNSLAEKLTNRFLDCLGVKDRARPVDCQTPLSVEDPGASLLTPLSPRERGRG